MREMDSILPQNKLTHSMLSLLEDKLRNKKKNNEETTFQWKALPSWTALQSNSKKKISSVSEGTQNDMNRENGQLLRESIIYEITETTRFQAKVATEIFEQLQYVLQQAASLDEARTIIHRTTEQSKRLAIFGLSQAKNQERIAKNYAIDALNIPAMMNSCKPSHKLDSSKSSCKDNQQTTTDPEAVETTMATMQDHVDTEEEEEALFLEDGARVEAPARHTIQRTTATTKTTTILNLSNKPLRDGYQIQFNSTPQPWRLKTIQLNPMEQQADKEAVQKFLQADIIEVSPSQNLKDAYAVVGLHPQSRKYLTFMNQGVVYQYKTLAFGMSVSPRVFSKMMRFAVEQLRKEGIRFVYYLDDVCLLAKTKEEMSQVSSRHINAIAQTGVSRLCIQFGQNEDYSTIQENQQVDQSNQTSSPDTDKILQMRWEAPFLLLNNSRTELTWWLTYVTDMNGLPIQRIDNPTPAITIHVDASDIVWGVSSPEIETTGCWTDEEKTQSINVRELSAILQYYRSKIRNQVRRYLIHNITTTGSGNTRFMQLLQSEGRISTYSKNREYSGRQPKSNNDQESSVRSSNTEEDLQHTQSSMGTIENRCICIADKSPTSSILESAPRTGSDSPRCLQPTVGKDRKVSVSTLETHSTSNPANQATEDPIRSSSDTTVDDTTLVSDGIAIETISKTDNVQASTMENDRMEVIRKKRKNDGLKDDEIEFLNHVIRRNTNRVYNMGWRKWETWCADQDPKINSQEYNTDNVFKFLMDNCKYSVQHLNGIRSAIASVFKIIHPDQPPLAQQEKIVQFFQAKRHQEIRIPADTDLKTWDTDILTKYIKTTWANNDSLSLFELQLKTIVLLCLATMARPRSDIGRLEYRNIHFRKENNQAVSVIIHFVEAKKTNMKSTQLGLIEDCKATTSVRSSTVTNWTESIMAKAGINTIKCKAHLIRSTSSTKAVEKSNTIQEVKQHANWSSNANTFEKYYYKPRAQESSSTRIANSIFSLTTNYTTFEDRAESRRIVVDTTNNTNADEAKSKNVVYPPTWYQALLKKYFG
ncbi:hypothetical protein G6F36_010105 [Rhizopus arrhizus]|nr:hypothetical protein G6F36_010105 [Rhizopus arrhizus]